MARSRKKSKSKNDRLIDIILITISFIFILPSIFIIYGVKKINNENFKLKEKLDNEKIVEKENKNNIEELNKKIELLNNIDKNIIEARENYFKTLKLFEDKVSNKEIKYKIAYLTFDDGPYYSTYDFLNILNENDVLATFFTTSINGEFCHDNKKENCYNLYNEYLKHGHTIANHTYTHSIFNGLYKSTDAFISAVINQEYHIKNITNGYITNIVRYPGGSSSANAYGIKDSTINELKKRNYGWIDWTAQDGDGGALSSTEMAWKNFTNTIDDDIEIVLFHDYSKITLAILPNAIKYLKDNNYILAPLFYESKMVNK